MSEESYEGGKFQLHFTGIEQPSYNLILNQIDVDTKYPYGVYYSHQDVSELILDKSGYLQGNISNLTSKGAVFKTDSYYRATLDFDGVFRFYAYPRLKLVSHLPAWH
ncbi:g-type lectin s-receptor-like serine/threonine-protein kinase lecrk3 [Quercus suber]|uniref:G-type lectin s-receptor-like serine/threonine-protein kinase lecrk3 n=1 Tax=Quercus suber TaxID=58331 RepID=A0AAW0M724_QUESU